MLKPLRLKLSLAFMAATSGLIVLVGGSAYGGLSNYFEKAVDLNLMHRMANQFQLFGFSLPVELAEAEAAWLTQQAGTRNAGSLLAYPFPAVEGVEESEEDGGGQANHILHELSENVYGSDTLLVFVLPLDENGSLLFNPNPYPLPMEPDLASSQAALANGSDMRFGRLPSGERVRLLSYRTSPGENPAVLQVGRELADQDEVLAQLAASTGIAGVLILGLVGVGSWWLAGRTLVPAQFAWDQQQTFVANASHELRTPLTLLRASTEVALRGDLGISYRTDRDVLVSILERVPATAKLAGAALLIAIVIGVATGVVAALRQNSLLDTASIMLATMGVSIPNFWLGLLLIYLLAVNLRWLPPSGYGPAYPYLLMPAITLGTGLSAVIARLTRSSMLEVIRQDYVRTARAKGLAERRVVLGHALRNAAIPIVTVVGVQLSGLLSGAVITERVFSWPGVGRLLVDSIFVRDLPMAQGCVLFIATVFIGLNLLVDLSYAWLDPRIKYE